MLVFKILERWQYKLVETGEVLQYDEVTVKLNKYFIQTCVFKLDRTSRCYLNHQEPYEIEIYLKEWLLLTNIILAVSSLKGI